MRKPKKYKPEFCQMLLDHSKQGLSFEAFCAKIGVSRQTLKNWAEKYPEFGEAKEIALSNRIELAERTLWLITTGKLKGNVTGAIFILKNIAGWRDSVEEKVDNNVTINLAYDLKNIPKPKD